MRLFGWFRKPIIPSDAPADGLNDEQVLDEADALDTLEIADVSEMQLHTDTDASSTEPDVDAEAESAETGVSESVADMQQASPIMDGDDAESIERERGLGATTHSTPDDSVAESDSTNAHEPAPVDDFEPSRLPEAPERDRAHLRPRKSRKLSRKQERRLAQDRTEPCDAADLFLQSSESRLNEATMSLAECRVGLRVADRMVQRATDRFEEDLDEDRNLTEILAELAAWERNQQSVAWAFADRARREVVNAAEDFKAATAELANVAQSENVQAEATYRRFATRIVGVPLLFLYLYSVLILTSNRFNWLLHYFPPFNLGRVGMFALLAAPCCWVLLVVTWRYTSAVRIAQKTYVERWEHAQRNFRTAVNARRELHRLSAQFDLIEPFMRVLANGYRSSWTVGSVSEIAISTDVRQSRVPASLGLARAIQGDGASSTELQNKALREVVRPGWRTSDLEEIAGLYAAREGIPETSVSLNALDSDLGEYATSTGARLLTAFADDSIQQELGSRRLRNLVDRLHSTLLRGVNRATRPPVQPLRQNGYESLDLSSTWLREEEFGQDWSAYLTAIFTETPPIRTLSIANAYANAFRGRRPVSTFMLLDYLANQVDVPAGVRCEVFPQQLSPVDIVVRVDNSEWAAPQDFKIFAPASPRRADESPASAATKELPTQALSQNERGEVNYG